MADVSNSELPASRKEAKRIGSKYFFTGVSCKQDHLDRRYTCNGQCCRCKINSECRKQKENPEWANTRNARWQTNHREQATAKVARWRAENPDHVFDVWKRHYEANIEIYRKNYRGFYVRHREQENQRSLAYAKANPDRINAIVAKRRARKLNAEGSYTEEDVKRILLKQENKCFCGTDITIGYTIDHIVPLARGGSNWPSNIQGMCKSCNSSKGIKTMDEWLKMKGIT